ncbi:MAG: hypothetical protein FJ125_05085, partial [Deltaproteobacteria bacterium]|nr:hypothetical protein [Deltaproteobacteria bacterium]
MSSTPIFHFVPQVADARQPARRMVPALLLLAALLPAAPPARAAAGTLDVERFRPAAGPGRLIGEEQPEVLEHLGFATSLLLGYSAEPLVFASPTRGRITVVSDKVGMDFTAAFGLWGRAELGAVLPATLSMSGEAPPALEGEGLPAGEGQGLGDLRLALKVALVQGGPFALSLVALGSLPTGSEERYRGDGDLGGSIAATSQLDLGPVALVLNGGYRLRQVEALPGTYGGDEIIFGGGGLFRLVPDRLDLRAELSGATGVGSSAFGGESETALETRLAAAFQPSRTVWLLLGMGIPVLHGVGTP